MKRKKYTNGELYELLMGGAEMVSWHGAEGNNQQRITKRIGDKIMLKLNGKQGWEYSNLTDCRGNIIENGFYYTIIGTGINPLYEIY